MSGECLICGGPTTEYGACERTLQALREERTGRMERTLEELAEGRR